MRTVKGVIQVVGDYNVPSTPQDPPELRAWYYKVRTTLECDDFNSLTASTKRSVVFLPTGHRLLTNTKPFKKHGMLHDAGSYHSAARHSRVRCIVAYAGPTDEPKPIKLLIKAFDKITTYIPEMLDDTFIQRIRK